MWVGKKREREEWLGEKVCHYERHVEGTRGRQENFGGQIAYKE